MSSCAKTQMLSDTVTEETLIVASKETELEHRDESDQYSIFGQSRPSCFRCKIKKALLDIQETLIFIWCPNGQNSASRFGEQKV